MESLPNFIIIGAGKSGTTALYEHLSEHPEVYVSKIKETNFFALEGTEMINSSNDPDQMYHFPDSITTWEKYKELFADVTDEKAIGEVSPMYLYSPLAAQKIKDRLPETKIIAILRDPVDRLYSRYMHLVREHREPTKNFADALDKSTIWWKRNDLVSEGFYHQNLSIYFELFDESQIRVYLYDDLRKNPIKVISDIYEFIGVDPYFTPDLDAEYNVSGKIQNNFYDKLIGQKSIIKEAIKVISPRITSKILENQDLRRWVNKMRKANLKKEPLQPELRKAIIEQVYQSEILKLQDLLKRDLSKWLQTK